MFIGIINTINKLQKVLLNKNMLTTVLCIYSHFFKVNFNTFLTFERDCMSFNGSYPLCKFYYRTLKRTWWDVAIQKICVLRIRVVQLLLEALSSIYIRRRSQVKCISDYNRSQTAIRRTRKLKFTQLSARHKSHKYYNIIKIRYVSF